MDVQGGLFDPRVVLPLSSKEYFDIAWRLLPTKSRHGLSKGEATQYIYAPFQELLFFETGLIDYYLSLNIPPREALREALRQFPGTTWERKLRDKLAGYESDEETLEKYNANN